MAHTIHTMLGEVELELETRPSLFSPAAIDRGTSAMLSTIELGSADRVLDLGCGYGVVGIWAARQIGADRVVMLDRDPDAVELARQNAKRNGVGGIATYESDGLSGCPDAGFTLILCNPPYHEDFAVPREFVHKGFNRLALGGRMVLVTRRRTWYRNKLTAIFGGAALREIDGYCVWTAEKRRGNYANAPRRSAP